jgi:hypothetical protein
MFGLHSDRLTARNTLSLELLRFENRVGEEYYALMLIRADKVRDLRMKATRKNFDPANEGAILFSGLGEPAPETVNQALHIFHEVAAMLERDALP